VTFSISEGAGGHGAAALLEDQAALDLVGAVVMLLLLAPLMLVASVLVVLDVGWPVVFWQQRPGLGGGNSAVQIAYHGGAHDADGRRVPEHRRVSRIGYALRRLRIDELPQLLNILIGEMSFIGPRPLLPADQSTAYAARLLVRPGLTGWAQVKAGRDVSARQQGGT
jgi:lipopolysaccharide/colanic/teichoic acid biosynthesis glycosyltransferase